jgi:hypothetical protein
MCDLVAEDESMNKPLAMFGMLTLSAVAFVRAASGRPMLCRKTYSEIETLIHEIHFPIRGKHF